jgi:hypothetical protein
VEGRLVSAAATLVFAAVAQRYEVVTWQHVAQRLRPGETKATLVAALEVLRKHGVVLELEREVAVDGPEPAAQEAEPANSRKRRLARGSSSAPSPQRKKLQMTAQPAEPAALVLRSGQESFPKFKLKPLQEWPHDPVLDGVKTEHLRRDQRRAKGARTTV